MPVAYVRPMNIRSRQLGERLLQHMAEKHWGVREMSRKLEMSAQWVSSVTRGLHRPDPVQSGGAAPGLDTEPRGEAAYVRKRRDAGL